MIEYFTYVIDPGLQVQTYFIPIHSFPRSFIPSGGFPASVRQRRIALTDTPLPDTLIYTSPTVLQIPSSAFHTQYLLRKLVSSFLNRRKAFRKQPGRKDMGVYIRKSH